MLRKPFTSTLILCVLLASLTGCVPASFSETKAQSEPIVKELQAKFNLANFTKGPILGGVFSFESGGDPNLVFIAKRSGTANEIADVCQTVDIYARTISSTRLTFLPRRGIEDKNAKFECLGDLLTYQHEGFRWNGRYKDVPISLVLNSSPFSNLGASKDVPLVFQLEVSTNIEVGKEGLAAGEVTEAITGIPKEISTYLNTLQDYRQKHAFKFFTKKLIEASGAQNLNTSEIMTPLIDSTGLVTKIKVHRLDSGANDKFDVCYSLLPWNQRFWGIQDPGNPRPLMRMEALTDLNSFGQFVSWSNCRVDDSSRTE